MDRKQLWTDLTGQGLIPQPNQATQDNIFGSLVDGVRAFKVYKVVYGHLNTNIDRELDIDQWPQLIANSAPADAVVLGKRENRINLYKFLPPLCLFILNENPPAVAQVSAIEAKMGHPLTITSVMLAKRELRLLNINTWTRAQNFSEEQGGKSVLGKVSEILLARSLGNLIDESELFSSASNKAIASYGDFVLMALPNNLWISVKSGYAKERLLGSGFSNDVIGVGYFETGKEFKSVSLMRNHRKAGFLAIYLPDAPINETQETLGINIYDDVIDSYRSKGIELPTNINGNPFLRKLSSVISDIDALKAKPIKKRTTIDF